MEFIKANLLNTTTQLTLNSNTGLASNVFNRDELYQYYSDGFADDLTTTSITVTFDATTSVSRLALIDINLTNFNIFYNGSTANSITILNGDTSTISYSANTDTNKYFRFNTLLVSSITLDAKKTISADQEKLIGYILISDLDLELEKIPSADQYNPRVNPKQVVHKMSDGGTRINTIRRKKEATLNLKYVSEAQKNSLYDIYESNNEFNFVPFVTATGWDGFLFEAVWEGAFDFFNYSDNAASSGFSGQISLKETPV